MSGLYSNTSLYGVFSVCYALASISTGLRLYVRRFMTLRQLQLDDYLLIASFGAFTVSTVLSLFIVSNDVLSPEQESLGQIRQNLKMIFALGFLYILDLWLIKYSLLAFYTYIFSRPGIKLFIRITAVYLALTMAGCYIAQTLFCQPVAAFWDPLRVDCHNSNGLLTIYCVLTVTSDALVMIIPLGSLPTLHINMQKKISLYLLFAVGSFVIAASVIRTTMAIRNPDTIAPVLLWSMVEETVATLVANAPILRVLVFRGRTFGSWHTTGHRGTVGYTRERTLHDTYEMATKGNSVAVVSSSKQQDKGNISREDALVVLRTVEVSVQSESVKGKDEDTSSSESTTWIP